MFLAALVSWALVAAFAVFYFHRLDARRRAGRLVQRAMDRSASPFRFDLDARTTCLVDDPEPAVVPNEVRASPLSASSVKQAAYCLAKAEQAVRQKRFEAALDDFRKVEQVFPGIRGVQASIATMAMHLKRFELAAEAYEKAAQEGPLTVSMANGLGVACMHIGDLDKAEQVLQDALGTNPKLFNTYQNLATLYRQRGQIEKAAGYLEKYISLRPDDTMAAQTYALLHIRMQKWDRAAGLLLEIVKKNPEVAPFHFHLAQALAHLNQREAALAALKRATRLMDPQQALARLSKSDFDLLRNEPAFRRMVRELGAKD